METFGNPPKVFSPKKGKKDKPKKPNRKFGGHDGTSDDAVAADKQNDEGGDKWKPEYKPKEEGPKRAGEKKLDGDEGAKPETVPAWVDFAIPSRVQLIQTPPHERLPRMMPGTLHMAYWEENGRSYLRFIMDYYLAKKQGWRPFFRSREEFLLNKNKKRKICEDLACTKEEYIQHFELDRTTRDQHLPSNYAPVWYLAIVARKATETDFYKRVWMAAFEKNPWESSCYNHLVRIHPPGIELVKGWEKFKEVTWYESKPKTNVTWREFVAATWDTIEDLEKGKGKAVTDGDPDFSDS
ncbi:hypothetical protein BJ508DRAFT_419286 [Ascobolus immersus RN42]|uniref:Uncharacterized protein n=1 Tax=Ascobolus immersus RN42 TaxID=1160509 RepID=A0A3N4HT20_ASCIM|nr:hypothetical protein BJ508DRAFT_419286 [Ascobolus immersus RN42]